MDGKNFWREELVGNSDSGPSLRSYFGCGSGHHVASSSFNLRMAKGKKAVSHSNVYLSLDVRDLRV